MQASILVVISGSGTNLQAIIDACHNGHINARICAVVSNVADVFGLQRAENAGIQTLTLEHKHYASRDAYDQALAARIDEYAPDLIVLAGFMRILTEDFVKRYHGKLINIHPSLLPKYQGLHTHQRALEAKDKEHGATVHFVSAELDGGPAIIQGGVPILSDDDEASLAQRVQLDIEHQIYPLAVRWCLERRVILTEQGAELDGELLPSGGFKYHKT